jgi:hypothetical protein
VALSSVGESDTSTRGDVAENLELASAPALLAAERRGRDPGLPLYLGDHHSDIVDEAERPILTGLQGSDQGMVSLPRVPRSVPVRRAIAAADLAAFKADPQMEPGITGLQALFATLN